MNEKRREVNGSIFSHAEGLGTVTRRMIEDRAHEIAIIDGRSRSNKEDFLRARGELLGMRGIKNELDGIDEDYESLDPSELPPEHGHQAPNFETDDEEQVQFELVEHGVEEADHEHMLEGHLIQEDEDEIEEPSDEAASKKSRKKRRKAS